jgi:hypothetical protein
MPQQGEPFASATAATGQPASLDAAALARWDRDGVLPVRGLAPMPELAPLRGLVDRAFAARRDGDERGCWFDLLEPEEPGAAEDATHVAWPSAQAPWLASTALRRNAHALARRLLGPEAELVWEAAVLMPPRGAPAQSWRQDEAGFTPGTPYREAVSVWVPLQEVTEGTGCPRFQRGSHRGPLLPHAPRTGPGLAARGASPWPEALLPPPAASIVAVPLRAGDAVVHHSRTLHALGANAGAQPRRALVLDFAVREGVPASRGVVAREAQPVALMSPPHARRPPGRTPLAQQLRQQVRKAFSRFGW